MLLKALDMSSWTCWTCWTCQDDPIVVIPFGVYQALEAHANKFRCSGHGYTALAGLQALHLRLHLVCLEQALAHHAAQGLAHCNRAYTPVLFPERDQVCGTEDVPGAGGEPLLNAQFRQGTSWSAEP